VCGSPSGYKNPLLLLPVALDKITADYHLDFSDLLSDRAHFMETGTSSHEDQSWWPELIINELFYCPYNDQYLCCHKSLLLAPERKNVYI